MTFKRLRELGAETVRRLDDDQSGALATPLP